MAHNPLSPRLANLVRVDGDWLRCNVQGCGDRAYWGVFRPTDWVLAKAQAHHAKVHGGAAPQGRPQRRNAALRVAAPPPVANFDILLAAALGIVKAKGDRLGEGVFRRAYSLGDDFVVKVAKGAGMKHNLAEMRDYKAAPRDLQALLNEPLWVSTDGSYLIARKAQDVGHIPHSEARAFRLALNGRVGDMHEGNFGRVNGRIVAIDFGFGAQA